MSWSYEIEFNIAPRKSFGDAESNALHSLVEKKIQELNDVPFATLTARQVVMAELKQSATSAVLLAKSHQTEFPTSCQVRIRCSGHADDDVLNYGPSHTHVEVVVIPVPHRR